MQPSIIFLNGMGHVEITWPTKSNEKMRKLIEKKMAEGIRFFMVKPKLMGLLKGTTEVLDPSKVDGVVCVDEEDLIRLGVNAEKIKVTDPDLSELAASGDIQFTRRDGSKTETIGYARTADEVLTNKTIATPQLRGG